MILLSLLVFSFFHDVKERIVTVLTNRTTDILTGFEPDIAEE